MVRALSPIGKQIQRWQSMAGMSDQALAFRLQVRESTLWRWKHGIGKVRPLYLKEIARLCGVKEPTK